MNHTRIDDRVSSRDNLKLHDTLLNLDDDEGHVLIEGSRPLRRARTEIAAAKLARRAAYEVGDAALWHEALVHVIVAAEDDLHAVLDEERLENSPEIHLRPVAARGGVQRVMEIRNLPGRGRRSQLPPQPRELRWVHVIAVQRKKLHVQSREAVITLAVHVEERVVALLEAVVVAQARKERDATVQQSAIGCLKAVDDGAPAPPTIDVVARRQDHVVWHPVADDRHQTGDVILLRRPRAEVADDRKSHGLPACAGAWLPTDSAPQQEKAIT